MSEGFCPTCGQHHLAESDTEELHAMLTECGRLEREVLAENERLRQQLAGAVEPQIRRIRIFALTGISTGEYKQALAAIVEITGEELA